MSRDLCQGTAKRLLKCFCGCSDMTEDEVQRIYRLNAQATLIDLPASKMLRSFLLEQRQRSGSRHPSETEQLLDVYEKCAEYMRQESVLTLDELDELSELGLPYHLERELKRNIQTGEMSNIERCLMRIQGECRNEIDDSAAYNSYKEALLRKLQN